MATTVENQPATAAHPPSPVSPRDPRARIRRAVIVIAVLIAAVVAGTWGYRAWRYSRSHESTENAQVDGHIVPVLAKVGGFVSEVRVAENDTVRSGDTLVMLGDEEYRVKLAQADADLAAAAAMAGAGAGAATGQAQAQVGTATGQQSAIDAQIVAERAVAARAKSDLARYETLATRQIVSQAQLDQARSAAQEADARVQALEQQAAAAGATVTSAEAGVRLAHARLLAARAARANAALQLEYTRVLAPEGGVIARKQVEKGQLVQAGQPLMAIVADTGVWITANFKETQLATVHVGQLVEIDVDAYQGCTVEGRVQSISSATGARFALLPPDNATGNFTKVVQHVPVRIDVTRGCGPDRPLRPGMSAVAHVRVR